MPVYRPDGGAECLIYTFKEGLLSKVAHDLELRVTAFEITVADDGQAVSARFDAGSLRVERTMHGGKPGAPPSAHDRETIEGNVAREVLEASRFPEIRFASTGIVRRDGAAELDGTIALHGRTAAIKVHATQEGGRWVAEVRLHQPDFGIKPYSAMLGTLRVRADVVVKVAIPA